MFRDFPRMQQLSRSFHGAFTELSRSFHGAFTELSRIGRDRYQFRRSLHLANTPSSSARSCARPSSRPRGAPLRPLQSGAQLLLLANDALDALRVHALVERFDRRGTEPFELFRSEFGQNSWNQNSVRIKEILEEV